MSFPFPGFRPNFARQARLSQLSPVEAVRALYEGEFGIGDEPALCFAIRRDPRVSLDDDAILGIYFDVRDEMEDDSVPTADYITPEAFLDRLARSG